MNMLLKQFSARSTFILEAHKRRHVRVVVAAFSGETSCLSSPPAVDSLRFLHHASTHLFFGLKNEYKTLFG